MIRTIFAVIIIWALLFGVNIGGRHYGISCGNDGVTLQLGGK